MKIGLYLWEYNAKEGGSFTFQESILNTVRTMESHHEIVCFYYGEKQPSLDGRIRWVRLVNPQDAKDRPLNEAILKYQIELVWFITVPIYETVDAPYIFTVWDLMHRAQTYFPEVSVSGWTFDEREQFYQHVLPRAAYVITGNQAGAKAVVDFYHLPEERVKPLSLPTPDFALQPGESRAPEGFSEMPHFLFYPAQYWPHKNHIALLLALKLLLERDQLDFSVVFTGTDMGNLPHVQDNVAKLGLSDRVHFQGFVPREELTYLYQNAFALVYPSFFGPDNIPPLEAFALGCPVVAARVFGAEEQMGNAALMFDPRDEVQLAEKIKELHSTPGLREELIQRGHVLARGWTAKEYTQEIYKLADELQPIRRCWSSSVPFKHV